MAEIQRATKAHAVEGWIVLDDLRNLVAATSELDGDAEVRAGIADRDPNGEEFDLLIVSGHVQMGRES